MRKVLWAIANGAAMVSVCILIALAAMGVVVGPAAIALHFDNLWWLLSYTPLVLAFLYQVGKDYV